jgi:hypothetical protein
MNIKNFSQKAFIFAVNLLIVVLIIFGIREANRDVISATETTDTTSPVNGNVLQAQADIATDRENKLRDLNNAPKSVVQSDQTTTTIKPQASTAAPATAKTPSRKTKTS